jgi:rRNA small subunit methyltransferase G
MQQIDRFLDYLLEYNQHTNLTGRLYFVFQCSCFVLTLSIPGDFIPGDFAGDFAAIRTKEEAMERHVHDSLALLTVIETHWEHEHCRLVDVGSGAGLPGVLLAIARPNWQVGNECSCVDVLLKLSLALFL